MTTPSTYKLGYPPLKYSTVPAISMDRAPTTSDVYHPTAGGVFPIPTIWSDKSGDNAYVLTSVSSGPVANWEPITVDASGTVVGPASSTDNALARFDSTSGTIIQNSVGILSDTGVLTGLTSIGIGIAPTAWVTIAAGTAAAGTSPLKLTLGVNLTTPEEGAIEYDGVHLTYTDDVPTRNVLAVGPASSTDNALTRFNGALGAVQESGILVDDDDVMLYPAEAGPVLTSGGTNPRKGAVTLVGGAATVATTAALADSVICLSIVALGTVTDPMPMLITIDPGVDFDITSEDAADTSTINWAIVA
jgi:hypothetical protein